MNPSDLTRRQAITGAGGALAAIPLFPALSAFDDCALSPQFIRLREALAAALMDYRAALRFLAAGEPWIAGIERAENMSEEVRESWRRINPFTWPARKARDRTEDAVAALFTTQAQTEADKRLRFIALDVQEAEFGEHPSIARCAFARNTVDPARFQSRPPGA